MFEEEYHLESARPTLRYILPEFGCRGPVVARCDALIRTKPPTNCDAHPAESPFQTRSNLI